MLAILEPTVGLERAQERLLKGIVGPRGAELAPEEPQDLGAVLLVEALEGRDRHGRHHLGSNAPRRRSVSMPCVRAAVIGHVEWIEFVEVEHIPRPGEIVHAETSWEQAAGGGAVAAIQLALLADSVLFFTALGAEEIGRRAKKELEERGVEVHASFVDGPQRRGITYVDEAGERTITTLGARHAPRGHDDSLPWHELARCDAVYFCAGDVDALVDARRARVLVATARMLGTLKQAAVELDAIVGSATDEAEVYRPGDLDPEPRLAVATSGSLGGWAQPGGPFTAAPLPATTYDSYGAGDCFAAGLAFALGSGLDTLAALEFASRCGAGAIAGPGVHAERITLDEG